MDKVLMIHSYYEQLGGEDLSYAQERKSFLSLGYEVVEISRSNAQLKKSLRTALDSLFNIAVFLETFKVLRRVKPNLMYVNNTWPAISPSPLLAARLLKVPTLQAVRNYRLVSPSAKLDDEGRCISCKGSNHPWSCVISGCYRNSISQTVLVALSAYVAKIVVKTWNHHRYLATSSSVRRLICRWGISEKKVLVRPNFLDNPGNASETETGFDAVYVGRLSEEKGVVELAASWPSAPLFTKLKIVGVGPCKETILSLVAKNENLEYLGSKTPTEVRRLLMRSVVSIVPSQWAEPFGRSVIESLEVGTPVICTRSGALPDILGEAGFVLNELNEETIREAVNQIIVGGQELRREAHARFLEEYSLQSAVLNMKGHIMSISP